MAELLHQLIHHSASRNETAVALQHMKNSLSYSELSDRITCFAKSAIDIGLEKQERIAVYLPKQFETVISFFGTTQAAGVFVPVNPLLKGEQVGHILRDCGARMLVTSIDRLKLLHQHLEHCHDVHTVILVGKSGTKADSPAHCKTVDWDSFMGGHSNPRLPQVIDADMASILYTSGSTGKPKGVVLSHQNMVAGAKSVAQYLDNTAQDRLLAVLPFSFDYGFSQLSTAFHVGATTVLMDYLLPRDVIRAVARYQITGLAAVPPLWIQLAQLPWPESDELQLRYLTNSGGAMPRATLDELRTALPSTEVVLMYGLTEAFRSTYLPPSELDRRPDSMGKAIPNAEVMVVRDDGSPCAPGEPGELVHRGALVAMGYWGDPERTAERFRPTPNQERALPLSELAVWSGDRVKMDEDGFLYFIGRKDEMIKTSGYRVSPTEIEETIYQTGLVGEVAAMGIPHPSLGQAIVVVATAGEGRELDIDGILTHCRQVLPAYMIPSQLFSSPSLPRNPNGKIDRKSLSTQYQQLFTEQA